MTAWTDADMPSQRGRVAFVTGATSGLGLQVATKLAAAGARVLLGARSSPNSSAALAQVASAASHAAPEFVPLDLMSLSSVATAAAEVRARARGALDLLVNNAGIIAPPRELSENGFESQWATHVIGHASLTWQLMPEVLAAGPSRIVTVTSIAHHWGAFDPKHIEAELRGDDYRRFRTYNRTKLAGLLLARELQRRLSATGARTLSVAAHPGMAETAIAGNVVKRGPRWMQDTAKALYGIPAQPVEDAAWPVLFAATFPRMKGGYLIGPPALALRGRPTAWAGSRASRDPAMSAELWSVLERVTDVHSDLPAIR